MPRPQISIEVCAHGSGLHNPDSNVNWTFMGGGWHKDDDHQRNSQSSYSSRGQPKEETICWTPLNSAHRIRLPVSRIWSVLWAGHHATRYWTFPQGWMDHRYDPIHHAQKYFCSHRVCAIRKSEVVVGASSSVDTTYLYLSVGLLLLLFVVASATSEDQCV